MRPIVLSVAGSDPSGGAGIQADLKAIEACGGQAVTVIAAVTAQNSEGVRRGWPLAADLVAAQLASVLDDSPVAAVKTGMLGSEPNVRAVAEGLARLGPVPLVVDPLAASAAGLPLNGPATLAALGPCLARRATLITPNVADARALTGVEVCDLAGAERAARALLAAGWPAALVKGGHFGETEAVDLLVTPDVVRSFRSARIASEDTHGTGCVLSSAIATHLAAGLELTEAIVRAKEFVTRCILHPVFPGKGRGALDALCDLRPVPDGREARP